MNNEIIFGIIIGILLISCVIYFNLHSINKEGELMEESRVYQGPVPEGYDEEHFRKTGETKPLEDD